MVGLVERGSWRGINREGRDNKRISCYNVDIIFTNFHMLVFSLIVPKILIFGNWWNGKFLAENLQF
jgi:hypothetical protein